MEFARRSGRIAKEIRIVLTGTDISGQMFAEETRTVTLSRHGAGLVSRHKLDPEGILTMRFLGGSSEASIRLVGQLGEDFRGFVYGVAFVDDDLDFWELAFPPPTKWQVDFDAPLQCTSCHRREIVDQSEVEADVYALSESILRFCQSCGASTQWRQATVADSPSLITSNQFCGASIYDEVSSEEMSYDEETSESGDSAPAPRWRLAGIDLIAQQSPAPAPLPPLASAAIARTVNRRRDVRTRVSFTACVRFQDTEEIVECGNLSKGGFSFRSRKSYAASAKIDVSLPYYPGSQPVFVSAFIQHVVALPHRNFNYGAMYATTTKVKKSKVKPRAKAKSKSKPKS
jgi:hypothetical protein